MINVLTGVPKTTNVLNFMNAGVEYVLWLKNVVQMVTVLELNLVLLPFLIWDKGNAATFVKVLSFVAVMLFANPTTIGKKESQIYCCCTYCCIAGQKI